MNKPTPITSIERSYEELRAAIDGGNESYTHADALALVKEWAAKSFDPLNPPIWLVGQAFPNGRVVEIQGVFDTQEKAHAACHAPNYFVMPMTLNKEYAKETVPDTGAYFPITDEGVPKDVEPCKGMNCGTTTNDHSLECHAEHAAAIAGGMFVKEVTDNTGLQKHVADLSDQSRAWFRVCNTLTHIFPGWHDLPEDTGALKACKAIEQLAKGVK